MFITEALVCLWDLFIYFFTFLSFQKLQGGKKRGKRSWRHTSTIENIWTRWMQRHQERSPTITEVDHTSFLKANMPQHIWTAHVAYFGHYWWPSLMSLNLSCRYLLNDTSGVIGFSVYLWVFFFSFLVFISFLSSFFIVNCVGLFLELERVEDDIYNSANFNTTL